MSEEEGTPPVTVNPHTSVTLTIRSLAFIEAIPLASSTTSRGVVFGTTKVWPVLIAFGVLATGAVQV